MSPLNTLLTNAELSDEDYAKVTKTMPFIKKHLIKLQLKLEIRREAMNKK